jgi:CRP/FNR family transcriptional regulator, cyclic AMP receptor protein
VAKRGTDAVLAAVPLFDGLSSRHLKRIRDISDVVEFMPGATIVKEGTAGDSFFVVGQGQAKVIANGRTIRRLLPGDYFGEIALLDGGERTATVSSETPMTLVEIKRNAFTKLVKEEPKIALGILKGLARMVRQAERPLRG